jgi:hypothetical protein
MAKSNDNLISEKACMSSKRVFILGAGFSKMAGMPLATDLTDLVLAKFREDDLEDALEWLGYLQQRIEWLGDGKSKGINIEEVFDLASFDIELWKMLQQLCPLGRNSGDTPWQNAEDIKTWLSYMEEDLRDVIWQEQKKAKLDQIKKFTTHLKSDDVVLTFNYDTLLEESLKQQNKKWYYGFEQEKGHGVKILKMHGSINWIMVRREQKDNFEYPLLFEKRDKNVEDHGMQAPDETEYKIVLLRVPDESLAGRIENRDLQSGSKQYEIAIAGLGRYKPLSDLVGSGKIWNNAIKALRNCEQIYIIGFSLSPFDTMARLHFGGVMMRRSEEKKIGLPQMTLIDPIAGELKSDFKKVFGCSASIDVIEKKAEKVDDWSTLLDVA